MVLWAPMSTLLIIVPKPSTVSSSYIELHCASPMGGKVLICLDQSVLLQANASETMSVGHSSAAFTAFSPKKSPIAQRGSPQAKRLLSK
ncbi:hypothetical protein YQE_12875, partial [Dendroctonus ponderosae]